jgi:sulfite exporter TauE/SafE
MQTALVVAGFLTGLAGGPHCVAMCGSIVQPLLGGGRAAAAACAPAFDAAPTWRRDLALLAGRMSAYAALGALAATFMALLAALGKTVSALHPLWTMAQVAVLLLGLSLLVQARQPRIVEAWGARLAAAAAQWRRRGQPPAKVDGWQPLGLQPAPSAARASAAAVPACAAGGGIGPRGAFVLGASLALLPCGLLYSALAVAALASHPIVGAASMLAFALGSSLSFGFWQWLWRRGTAAAGSPRELQARWGIRLAGAALVALSLAALAGHDLRRIAEWCGVPL